MQFSTIFTVLAVAMTATATPVENLVARNGGGGSTSTPSCSNNQKAVCCNSLLGVLGCAVNILGGSCSGTAYCCSTDAAPGTLINIQALNCVAI
ncbi:hypothetical protein QBC46DRAFT_351473 [Diplogelasinospora grovesii]|uniref:Hydrophobin n=1 Tax=Diplogelasinospora grovesii TaxID=303347 RepID=A0AAN6ND61_9PEZI|nr:hypothetical protein QBC46DRAFT_351473 [Diplogelasinospora grovesii]